MNGIQEVTDYLRKHDVGKYYFVSAGQKFCSAFEPAILSVVFNKVHVGSFPTYIYFSNGDTYLRLDFIRAASIIRDEYNKPTHISIVCGGEHTPVTEREYVLAIGIPQIVS